MGQSSSRLFAYSIQGMAFAPPEKPGYDQKHAIFVDTTDGNKIACMLISPQDIQCEDQPRDLILYSHGNAEDMGGAHSFARWVCEETGCHVLMYDYVNYGHSSAGLMSEAAMYTAIDAVYTYACTQNHTVYKDMFIMGRSLGTTASVYLASRLGKSEGRPFKGLILQSPIASGFRVVCSGQSHMPDALCEMMDRVFCPVAQEIKLLKEPVFIIHGVDDTVVNISNAHYVQANIPQMSQWPPLYVTAGHNDIEVLHPDIYLSHLKLFLHWCKTKTFAKV